MEDSEQALAASLTKAIELRASIDRLVLTPQSQWPSVLNQAVMLASRAEGLLQRSSQILDHFLLVPTTAPPNPAYIPNVLETKIPSELAEARAQPVDQVALLTAEDEVKKRNSDIQATISHYKSTPLHLLPKSGYRRAVSKPVCSPSDILRAMTEPTELTCPKPPLSTARQNTINLEKQKAKVQQQRNIQLKQQQHQQQHQQQQAQQSQQQQQQQQPHPQHNLRHPQLNTAGMLKRQAGPQGMPIPSKQQRALNYRTQQPQQQGLSYSQPDPRRYGAQQQLQMQKQAQQAQMQQRY
eukprot:TRINITY_DN2742_c0_g1_i1.p1 TRINITY_DN2742_c0_g1~~TRINITY_DN2742_c0_g1_i1.p1  ORF type:complete len:296 (-),score=50.09 TRINITY_DN2742_c0_g1_i1:13-900(-)